MARTAWAALMAPWKRATAKAGIRRGTHAATTAAHPSSSIARSKCPIHSGSFR
jgi:hypothetical protein